MRYDGFTPGEADLALGVQELFERQREGAFSFLLANLIDRRSNKPVFSPYVIRTWDDLKVGIFGLLADGFTLSPSTGDREHYVLADPIETAAAVVDLLKAEGCRVIICVAHLPANEQRKLALATPGIHFLVSGHDGSRKPAMEEINGVEILRAGSKGEHLGQLEFAMAGDRLLYHYQTIPLDRNLADDPQIGAMVRQYKEWVRALIAEE